MTIFLVLGAAILGIVLGYIGGWTTGREVLRAEEYAEYQDQIRGKA